MAHGFLCAPQMEGCTFQPESSGITRPVLLNGEISALEGCSVCWPHLLPCLGGSQWCCVQPLACQPRDLILNFQHPLLHKKL